MRAFLITILLLGGLAACSTQGPPVRDTKAPTPTVDAPLPRSRPDLTGKPAIHTADRPLQCVPYARAKSGIQLRGDAYTWWTGADGRYPRGKRPKPGSVVVLDTGPRRGHLAVVTAVEGSRRIVVDHANWLNQGRIHTATPMVDVSAANDWSAVRVWYTPGNQLGASTYPVEGFIYPDWTTAQR